MFFHLELSPSQPTPFDLCHWSQTCLFMDDTELDLGYFDFIVHGCFICSSCILLSSHGPLTSISLQVLRRCEGTVELVDVSTELPQLARRPGLKKWKVSISE